jgi:hypothetical protein
MNTIGATSVGQNPFQFLQPTTSQQSSNSTGSTASATAAATASDPTSQLLAATGKHKHHHHGGGGKSKSDSSGVSDLLNAVTTALNSADPSADPDQVIQDTITKLLSGDGTGTDPSVTNSNTTTATGAAAAPTTAQSFAATLKAHGVDLNQFRADLTAAVKNAQNGQINPAAALKSIAPGSALNLTA